MYFSWGCNMFKAGTFYRELRQIEAYGVPMSAQQLQQLCSCCPDLESLRFTALYESPSTAWHALSQLTALADLAVSEAQSAPAAFVGAAAQLTGLRSLQLVSNCDLTDPMLLQLTALTALERLELQSLQDETLTVGNKAKVRPRWQDAVGWGTLFFVGWGTLSLVPAKQALCAMPVPHTLINRVAGLWVDTTTVAHTNTSKCHRHLRYRWWLSVALLVAASSVGPEVHVEVTRMNQASHITPLISMLVNPMLFVGCREGPLMCGFSSWGTFCGILPAAKLFSAAAVLLQQHLLSSCWRSLQPHWQAS
jgi:hypothetical protein